MTSQIADLEARTIVANNRIIFTSTFEAVNMNATIAYHRARTSSTDSAITMTKSNSLVIVNQTGDYSISANLASLNGNAIEGAIIL